MIKKIKNAIRWTYTINDLNDEEIIGTFYEKELQNVDQQEFRIEEVIKKKVDKLYIKRKGYDNSFNSWIGKRDLNLMNHMNLLVETLMSKLIHLVLQQKVN